MQFAFCLGIRYASHLSSVSKPHPHHRFLSSLNRYLPRWWGIDDRANAGSHSRTAKGDHSPSDKSRECLVLLNGGNRRVLDV